MSTTPSAVGAPSVAALQMELITGAALLLFASVSLGYSIVPVVNTHQLGFTPAILGVEMEGCGAISLDAQ